MNKKEILYAIKVPKETEPLLTPKEVAEILDLSLSQVYNLLDDEKRMIPHYRFNSSYRIDRDHLSAWRAEQCKTGKAFGDEKDEMARLKDIKAARKKEERLLEKSLRREKRMQREKEYHSAYWAIHKLEARVRNSIRRAKIKGATVGDIDEIKEIYRQAKEDEGIVCYLCGEVIPIGERHVDHLIPISRGGAHSVENLRITHARCNLIKHDKLVSEMPEGSF